MLVYIYLKSDTQCVRSVGCFCDDRDVEILVESAVCYDQLLVTCSEIVVLHPNRWRIGMKA